MYHYLYPWLQRAEPSAGEIILLLFTMPLTLNRSPTHVEYTMKTHALKVEWLNLNQTAVVMNASALLARRATPLSTARTHTSCFLYSGLGVLTRTKLIIRGFSRLGHPSPGYPVSTRIEAHLWHLAPLS